MNIGELARQTGASIRSLRYYETKQLLSCQREENGYRSYDSAAIERVKTIQFYLSLGLTTNEIFDIANDCEQDEATMSCDETDLTTCPEELELYKEKLVQIESQIASLERAKRYFQQRLARSQTTITV